MIELIDLHKKYQKLEVLKGVSAKFKSNECIALIGPNGCGKTTLIKSILRMVLPDKGEILFKGKSIKGETNYRHHIGYMPQIGRYPENMSIGQIFEMMKELRNSNSAFDDELYNEYKLGNILNKRMRTLSGGTTQKVSAALAFMFNPEVYILDEPTAGLDPIASEILKEKMMREKANGKLILITSHLLSDLDELVSELLFMQDGEMLIHKSVEDIKASTGEQKISKSIAKILKEQLV